MQYQATKMQKMKKMGNIMCAALVLAALLGGCAQPVQGSAAPVGGGQQAGAPAPQPAAGTQTPATTAIDEAAAKQIAFDHAGVAESDTDFLLVKPDYDDGRAVFDVEFYIAATGSEYDYEIDAATGEIRSYDYDAENYQPSAPAAPAGGQQITEQEARDIALARVPGATAQDISIRLERDDGRTVYEGRIIYERMEYEFEIDAGSGNVLEWNEESVFD